MFAHVNKQKSKPLTQTHIRNRSLHRSLHTHTNTHSGTEFRTAAGTECSFSTIFGETCDREIFLFDYTISAEYPSVRASYHIAPMQKSTLLSTWHGWRLFKTTDSNCQHFWVYHSLRSNSKVSKSNNDWKTNHNSCQHFPFIMFEFKWVRNPDGQILESPPPTNHIPLGNRLCSTWPADFELLKSHIKT